MDLFNQINSQNEYDDIIEFSMIDKSIQDNINTFINSDTNHFKQSTLYNSKENKRYIDTKIKSSKFKTFKDSQFSKNSKLFDMLDLFINNLNLVSNKLHFRLVRYEVNYIKYSPGDFFKKHTNYRTFKKINTLKEYTMLMCINSNCEGGETVFHKNGNTYTSKATLIPYSSIIFNKKITHEENIVTKGYKDILQLNLLCIPKKNKNLSLFTVGENINNSFTVDRYEHNSSNIDRSGYKYNNNNNKIQICNLYYYDSVFHDYYIKYGKNTNNNIFEKENYKEYDVFN